MNNSNRYFIIFILVTVFLLNDRSIVQAGNTIKFINKLIDSSDNSYNYGYGPSIIYDQGMFHMFYCSTGANGGWDSIRYASSNDGRLWSTPTTVLTVSNLTTERATCDPSVVYYNAGDGPYYYLFYSGNSTNVQTVMFVARSSSIAGPYYKYTTSGNWVQSSPDPKIILTPRHAVPDTVGWYGAGQQTVVVKKGRLYSWYYDDTTNYPTSQTPKLLFTSTTNPTVWTTPVNTNLSSASVDVKYDPILNRFVLFEIIAGHQQNAYLVQRFSTDGIVWSNPQMLCDTTCFPDYSNNLGVSGYKLGHLIDNRALIVYGAPYDLNPQYSNTCTDATKPYCWGYWDLYASVLNPAGSVWNDIPWGWQWSGMTSSHILALGDYDGDGKTDRAMVNPSSGQWYVIGSIPFQIY